MQALGAEIATGNQAVIDQADLILVCLPAAEGLEILRGLKFRSGQSVLSTMAGARIAPLRASCAPAAGFCAMMPGFANAFRAGPSLLYPPDPAWHQFLSCLGPVHDFETVEPFETAAVFGAMSGASVFLMRHLANWYVTQGLPPETARRLVAEAPGYVALRVAHSIVQATWNRVAVRFTLFCLSSAALLLLAVNAAIATL